MTSEAQNGDPDELDHSRVAGIDLDDRNGVDRRRRSLHWTITLIVLISCLGLAGTVAATLPDSFSATEPHVIQTVAWQTSASPHSDLRTAQLGATRATSSGKAEPSNEGGATILWLVALALMAVLWLGRRNDGGI